MKRYARRSRGEGSFRVYYPEQADLYLDDSTPLYLSWIIKSADGSFFVVPAEECGWLRRRRYDGPCEQLKPVASDREAQVILQMVLDSTPTVPPLTAQSTVQSIGAV